MHNEERFFPLEANMMMDLTGHANDCCGEKLLMLTRCHISDGGEELFSLTELWEPNRVKVHSFKKGTEQWVWVMENLSLAKFVHFSRAILNLIPNVQGDQDHFLAKEMLISPSILKLHKNPWIWEGLRTIHFI